MYSEQPRPLPALCGAARLVRLAHRLGWYQIAFCTIWSVLLRQQVRAIWPLWAARDARCVSQRRAITAACHAHLRERTRRMAAAATTAMESYCAAEDGRGGMGDAAAELPGWVRRGKVHNFNCIDERQHTRNQQRKHTRYRQRQHHRYLHWQKQQTHYWQRQHTRELQRHSFFIGGAQW